MKSKITKSLIMHMTGGGFSILQHDIFVDGKKTGIVMTTKTNGSPQYKVLSRRLSSSDDEEGLDLLNPKGVNPKQWILNQHES